MKNFFLNRGSPSPLGASLTKKGINFAFFAPSASEITLGIFDQSKLKFEIPLHNKTKGIWFIEWETEEKDFFYAYKVDGKWIVDPYAKELNFPKKWGEQKKFLLGKIISSDHFDWEGDTFLHIPFNELIIYEMHVRGFSPKKTFLGVIEHIAHLTQLGVNAVELLPVFEFKEIPNYWGYASSHFFAPMARYGTIVEFKKMIKALHKAGIEIILDVVYNHTGSFLDPAYYILDEQGNHTNYTGCGNTTSCNSPPMMDLILSSLRYWVKEMHVDGFRFDLASIFCRGEKGEVLDNPSIINAIHQDPILQKVKMIAEPWDCAGLYQVGSFPGNFAQWNGIFRDNIRTFLKGSDKAAEAFAVAMSGSSDLFDLPYKSINFITAHDGFTLRDLVSYNKKHNEENGENNQDGNDYNQSWNCGVEGPTHDPDILYLREKQMRNFILALGLALGTPMFLMGDEYGHTRNGNNNAYCQDNKKNYFLWNELKKNTDLFTFCKNVIHFRKGSPLFKKEKPPPIVWHGEILNKPNWNSRLVCYTIDNLYIAFNADHTEKKLLLPPQSWNRLVDTSLLAFDRTPTPIKGKYHLSAHSCLLLSTLVS